MDFKHLQASKALASLRTRVDPSLESDFNTFEELCSQKLWHQLTEAVLEFYKKPETSYIHYLFFVEFISLWEKFANPKSIIRIAAYAANNLKEINHNQVVEFLNNFVQKFKDEPEISTLAKLHLTRYYCSIQEFGISGKLLNECMEKIESIHRPDAELLSLYHTVASEHYAATMDYSSYYKYCLLYIACIDTQTLSTNEVTQIAYNLCIAALLGENIYSFGDLLIHPILNAIKNSEFLWLVELVYAFNRGDINTFWRLEPIWSKQFLLNNPRIKLIEKMQLMALSESIFKSSQHVKGIPFDILIKETGINESQIEYLIMKAFASGLISGYIDNVNKLLHITWAKPRILELSQLSTLKSTMSSWHKKVNEMIGLVNSQISGASTR